VGGKLNMPEFSSINMCDTAEPRYFTVMRPCIPRRKPAAYFPQDPDQEFERRHRWIDGICEHCNVLRADARMRIHPVEGKAIPRRGFVAKRIAFMAADVPPVSFIGEQHG